MFLTIPKRKKAEKISKIHRKFRRKKYRDPHDQHTHFSYFPKRKKTVKFRKKIQSDLCDHMIFLKIVLMDDI